nr:hypothetical protein [Sinorhizobium meliloti]
MAKQEWKWVRVKALSDNDKADIATACERFIAETPKPRLLPEIRPTKFNYPLDIFGRWRGSKYSFREVTRKPLDCSRASAACVARPSKPSMWNR